MKNNMALYKAMGNIDDNIIKETDDYQAEKKDRSRLFRFIEVAAIVAVVCGCFALSFVLLKVSGPKTNPAADGETSAAEVTVKENTKINEPVYLPVTTSYEEIIKMEPYSSLLPTVFPENYRYMVPVRVERLVYDEEMEKLSNVPCDKDYAYCHILFDIDSNGVLTGFDSIKDDLKDYPDVSNNGIFEIGVIKRDIMLSNSYKPEEITLDLIRDKMSKKDTFLIYVDCEKYEVSYYYFKGLAKDAPELPTAEEFYNMIMSSKYVKNRLTEEHEIKPKTVNPTLEEIYGTKPYNYLLPRKLIPSFTVTSSVRSVYNEEIALSSKFDDECRLYLYSAIFVKDPDNVLTEEMKDVTNNSLSKFEEIGNLKLTHLDVTVYTGKASDCYKPEEITLDLIKSNLKKHNFSMAVQCGEYYIEYVYISVEDNMPTAEEFYDMITSTPAFNK